MKRISVNGGYSFVSPALAIRFLGFRNILNCMDEELSERLFWEMEGPDDEEGCPGFEEDFLIQYLSLADEDLIIG